MPPEKCPVPLERIGIDDTYAESGPYLELLDKYGMSVEAIVAAAQRALVRKQASSPHATSEVY